MQNLPKLNITTDTSTFKIPREGDLENTYKPLKNLQLDTGEITYFTTDKLNYSINNPVSIEVQPSYDGSVNLILNDDLNPPLLVNSRFSVEENNTYSIPDHTGVNDTNIYNESNINLDTRLYKTINKIPSIKYMGLLPNGEMKCGSYHFYFKYCDADDNETDFIGESGLVVCHIGGIKDPKTIRLGMSDENSKKSVKFYLTNLDRNFDYIKVYYTRTTSDNSQQEILSAHEITSKFLVNSDSMYISILGIEPTIDRSIADINVQYELAGTVKSQAQCQNMLFFGNINKPDIPYAELNDLSIRIIPSISQDINIGNIDYNYVDRTGTNSMEYYNTRNIYDYLGYWPEEYYRFGIVYILNDFTLSPVFNVRGIDLSLDPSITTFDLYNDDNERIYIEYNDIGYITKGSHFENAKGVIKLKKNTVITEDGINPIGISFTIPTNVETELKKYIKGYFFVRQKRIPTILAQGCVIAKTIDIHGNLPVIPIGTTKTGKIQSFLNNGYLSQNSVLLSESKLEPKAFLSPEVKLRESLFNQIFTASNFQITNAKEQSLNRIEFLSESSPEHYYINRDNVSETSYNKPSLLTIINDGMKMNTDGKNYFSARAGEAEEAWSVVDVNNDWTKVPATTINDDKSFVRGLFDTYVGISDSSCNYGDIINIRPNGYSEDDTYKDEMFKTRFYSDDTYEAISDRLTFASNPIVCYRGDCFIGNFTHRINRNFIDPELPTNDKIIDNSTFKSNFLVKEDGVTNGVYSNRIVLDFKQKGTGSIHEPSEAKYNNLGSGLSSILGGDESDYVIKGAHKINRVDVNSVELGQWFTFKVMSNINISMRDINQFEIQEQSTFGHPRTFHPFQQMSTKSAFKLSDSGVINAAAKTNLSTRYNFLLPNIPFIKNKFDTRVLYSNIHVNDAFTNGFRTFKAGNYKDLPKTYGSITSIIENSGNLVATMENGVLLIPINERAVAAEGSGGNVYINTANVLPENPRVLSSNFGSTWKESVKITINVVYGVDTNAKKIWRTNGETFEILSDLKVQKFLNDNINLKESDRIPTVGLKNVKTHYNAFKGDVMFTFYNGTKIWNLCYNEKLSKFTTFYSWCPSYSENINNIFFSFNLDSIKSLNSYIDTTNNYNLNILGSDVNPFTSYLLPRNFVGKIADIKSTDTINLTSNLIKIDNNSVYYKNKDEYTLFFNSADTYIDIPVFINATQFNLRFYKFIDVDNNIWKHGQAGIYDLQQTIYPTKWYDKQELFEFEFIVADKPQVQKIFENLKIISNKAAPKEFEFEIVGETYDWYKYKDDIIYINSLVSDTVTLEQAYVTYLAANTNIKKLPFLKYSRSSSSGNWSVNTSNTWLIHDSQLTEDRIHLNQLANDIKITGRLKGNMIYLEDLWDVELRPINYKEIYLEEGLPKYTKTVQSTIRDKYLKVRVKYSGADLVIVQAIKTFFNISYA